MFYNKILQKNFNKCHSKVAFVARKDRSRIYNFTKYFHVVETVTKAFLKIGFKPGDSICIVATNRPEWCFSHFGAIEAGGIAVGIYPKNKNKTILYSLTKLFGKNSYFRKYRGINATIKGNNFLLWHGSNHSRGQTLFLG